MNSQAECLMFKIPFCLQIYLKRRLNWIEIQQYSNTVQKKVEQGSTFEFACEL